MTLKLRFLTILLAVTMSSGGPRLRDAATVHAQTVDPCATAIRTNAAAAAPSQTAVGSRAPKTGPLDHDDRWSHLDSLWAHRAAAARQRLRPFSASIRAAAQDVGEIAVLNDEGDLINQANRLDLGDMGIRLVPNASGGYDASRTSYGFRQPLGSLVALADDDSRDIALPFTFTFFGKSYDRVFLNSDGNLTFGEGDVDTSARSVSRLLTGVPRIAPFFADLDPSSGGRILTSAGADAFVATWCAVPEFDGPSTATVQVSVLRDGAIEFQISARTTMREAVVAISPGNTTEFTPLDLSALDAPGTSLGALGEQFTAESTLDILAVSRRFLATHPDRFDNLVMFTDTDLLTGAFAYEVSVRNTITGTNLPILDYSSDFGSGGQLQSVCNMDALSKYPDDPHAKFLGENSTVSVMGQEVGHRWLAFLLFRDHNGVESPALLGRDAAHWSFFFDSDASVLEGNDIEDRGDGTFRTVAAVQRFSLFDQYAMGLVDQTQVPPSFYVDNPISVVPRRTAESDPQVGVTFAGTRRSVSIDDVIAVHGPRVPSAAESPRVYRQAFVYVVSPGATASPAAIAKLDRIRVAWEQFFSAATDSRMRAETRLSAASSTQ
jgi:hypothetical protein